MMGQGACCVTIREISSARLSMLRLRPLFFILTTLLLTGGTLFSQVKEYALKAEFIERFTRFIEWPESSDVNDLSRPFIIGVVGENPFEDHLEKMASKRKIKEKRVEIQYYKSSDVITHCHVLFISGSEERNIEKILKQLDGKPTLSIGDSDTFHAKGVLINFFRTEKLTRFHINTSAIPNSGLKFSSRLLKLNTPIESGEGQ